MRIKIYLFARRFAVYRFAHSPELRNVTTYMTRIQKSHLGCTAVIVPLAAVRKIREAKSFGSRK